MADTAFDNEGATLSTVGEGVGHRFQVLTVEVEVNGLEYVLTVFIIIVCSPKGEL